MKILIVTPYLPYPNVPHAGGQQIMDTIDFLSKENEVHVFSLVSHEEKSYKQLLEKRISKLHTMTFERLKAGKLGILVKLKVTLFRIYALLYSAIKGVPYLVAKYHSPKFHGLIKKITAEEKFDIVELHFSFMGQYLSAVDQGKKILFEHDVSLKPFKRFYKAATGITEKAIKGIDYIRWIKYEKAIAEKSDLVVTVGMEDRDLLKSVAPSAKIVICNPAIPVFDIEVKQKKKNSLVFMGALDRVKTNVDAVIYFIEQIFPLVKKEVGDSKLFVIGPNAPDYLLDKAKDDVVFTGYLTEPEQFMAECNVFVAPIRYGGGVKIKILYAMAVGIPVVTSTIGAEGIEAEKDRDFVIEDEPQQFSKRVVSLLRDEKLQMSVGKNGLEFVRLNHSKEKRSKSVLNYYLNLLSK